MINLLVFLSISILDFTIEIDRPEGYCVDKSGIIYCKKCDPDANYGTGVYRLIDKNLFLIKKVDGQVNQILSFDSGFILGMHDGSFIITTRSFSNDIRIESKDRSPVNTIVELKPNEFLVMHQSGSIYQYYQISKKTTIFFSPEKEMHQCISWYF